MTFALLRAGLPNSMVAVALAVMPIVAMTLAPPERAPHASVAGGQMIMAAGNGSGASGDQAASN